MFKISLETYCDDCPFFSPIRNTVSLFANFEAIITQSDDDIKCKDADRCRQLQKQMTKNLVISTDDNTSTSKRDETNACYINPGHVPEVYFEGQKIAVIKMEYTWTTQSEKDIGLDIAVVHGYADGQTIERTFLLDFKTNVTTEAPTSTIVDQFREQYPWIYISKIIEIDPLTLRVETHNPKDTILAVYDLETKRFNIDWCISSVDESMCDDQLADLENI